MNRYEWAEKRRRVTIHNQDGEVIGTGHVIAYDANPSFTVKTDSGKQVRVSINEVQDAQLAAVPQVKRLLPHRGVA